MYVIIIILIFFNSLINILGTRNLSYIYIYIFGNNSGQGSELSSLTGR